MEGVESPELVQYLSDMNIRYMQGFYFYRPMPPERFETILADPGKADYDGISFHGNDSLRIRDGSFTVGWANITSVNADEKKAEPWGRSIQRSSILTSERPYGRFTECERHSFLITFPLRSTMNE